MARGACGLLTALFARWVVTASWKTPLTLASPGHSDGDPDGSSDPGGGAKPRAHRDYASGSSVSSFYRPREVRIEGIGLMNDGTAYFSTRSGVSLFQDGLISKVLEVSEGVDITSAFLCHHRSSIFYEVLAQDGGLLTLMEYSLIVRKSISVHEFSDTEPSTSLACADGVLLRASPSSLMSIELQTRSVSVLQELTSLESGAVISSLAVGFAADTLSQAQIYAVLPHNRSIARVHLVSEFGGHMTAHLEPVLTGGDGDDGPISSATVHEPHHVLWSRGAVLFVDGCALREIRDNHVVTLVGEPTECKAVGSEALEPVSWASRLSRPVSLAAAADGTFEGSVLMLTPSEVLRIHQVEHNDCMEHAAEEQCVAEHECGWAEGGEASEKLCLDCPGLRLWASKQRPAVDVCSLEQEIRINTRYNLAGCGCSPPPPLPHPTAAPESHHPGEPEDDGQDDDPIDGITAGQAALAAVFVVAAIVLAFLLYRRYRKNAALHELYGDTSEFYTFTDEG